MNGNLYFFENILKFISQNISDDDVAEWRNRSDADDVEE